MAPNPGAIERAPAAEVAPTPLDAIAGMLARARAAQTLWSDLPLYERVSAISKVRRNALADAMGVAQLLRQETGKPIEEALTAEVLAIADLLDYWVASIEAQLEPTDVLPDPMFFPSKRGRVERAPRGVIAVITPWNFPLAIPLRTIVPALMAGNAVIFKPSEHAPHVGALIASWFEPVLPPGLLQVVQGGAEAASRIIEGGVDAVCFTGGAESGRKVAVACAQRLVPCSLELGGKDAAIVLADARLERTARGIAWGAFNNSGQNCASIERVYVDKRIADAFLARLVAVTSQLRPGVDFGTMTTRAQFEAARAKLDEALAQGGQLLVGGSPTGESLSFPPTIVRAPNDTCSLMTEETFGPVLSVVLVDSVQQAISSVNSSRFGLTASIWSKSVGKAQRLARQLRTGVVTINNHGFTAALAMAPWSGTKDSGYGVTNGPLALDFLTRPFFVLADKSTSSRELWWHPYTPTLRSAGVALAKARGGAGFFGRIAAILALILLLPKRMLADR